MNSRIFLPGSCTLFILASGTSPAQPNLPIEYAIPIETPSLLSKQTPTDQPVNTSSGVIANYPLSPANNFSNARVDMLQGNEFEAVDTSSMMLSIDPGAAK